MATLNNDPQDTTLQKEAEEATARRIETWAALVTSVLAVALAISSIFSAQSGDDMMLNNMGADNKWAHFNTKSTKQILQENAVRYEKAITLLVTDTAKLAYLNAQIASGEEEVERYKKEKEEIKREAEAFQAAADKADRQGDYFDFAEALYNISIVLAALSILTKKRLMVFGGLGIGLAAMCFTAYALYIG